MCAVVLDAAGKRAFMFSGDWGKICLTFFWHMWIDDTGWKKQKINRLIYSPLSLMKHPPRHIERSREKNVFFVCFRYFQRVNIEAKIIDWVLTELLPFFLLASSSRFLSLDYSIHVLVTGIACSSNNTHPRDWNMPPYRRLNPQIPPQCPISTTLQDEGIKILEKSLFPWTEN